MSTKLSESDLAEIRKRHYQQLPSTSTAREWRDIEAILNHCTALEEELKGAKLELGEWRASETAETLRRHQQELASERERRTVAQDALRPLHAQIAIITASLSAAHEEIDKAWFGIENGWDIEPRSYFERAAPKNGFGSALAQAVHHMWKRKAKDNDAINDFRAQLVEAVRAQGKEWIEQAGRWEQRSETEEGQFKQQSLDDRDACICKSQAATMLAQLIQTFETGE